MKPILFFAALVVTGHLRSQTLTEYRYWVNDDPTTLATASITPASEVLLNATLDLPTLTRNFNTITFQFKDSNGDYSAPQTTWFTRNSGALNGYAYWIDDAISSPSSGNLGPNNSVDLIADLPTGTTTGTHFFTIRFSSVNGTWTVPLTTQFEFFTSVAELPGLSDLLLFPNPVTDELGLRLNADASRTLHLQVRFPIDERFAPFNSQTPLPNPFLFTKSPKSWTHENPEQIARLRLCADAALVYMGADRDRAEQRQRHRHALDL